MKVKCLGEKTQTLESDKENSLCVPSQDKRLELIWDYHPLNKNSPEEKTKNKTKTEWGVILS